MEFNLERFVNAQANSYETALSELKNGQKRSHWMWYVFPQLAGLGRSETARYFGLKSLAEAKAFLEHPLLGKRLKACTQATLDLTGQSADAIFGYPDTLKFKSCLTLFGQLEEPLFQTALDTYFDGEADEATLELLRQATKPV